MCAGVVRTERHKRHARDVFAAVLAATEQAAPPATLPPSTPRDARSAFAVRACAGGGREDPCRVWLSQRDRSMAPAAKESAEAWERTVDLVVRRVTYSAAAGACAAVVLFRTPGADPRLVTCARRPAQRLRLSPR